MRVQKEIKGLPVRGRPQNADRIWKWIIIGRRYEESRSGRPKRTERDGIDELTSSTKHGEEPTASYGSLFSELETGALKVR